MPIRETFDIDIKATDNTAAAFSSAGKNAGAMIRKEAEAAVRESERIAAENRRKLEREANQFRSFLSKQSAYEGGDGTSYTSRRQTAAMSAKDRTMESEFRDMAKVARVVAFAESAANVIGAVSKTVDIMLNSSKYTIQQLIDAEKKIADGIRSVPVAGIFFDLGQSIGTAIFRGSDFASKVEAHQKQEDKERDRANRLAAESLAELRRKEQANTIYVAARRESLLGIGMSEDRREAMKSSFERDDINAKFNKLTSETKDDMLRRVLEVTRTIELSNLDARIEKKLKETRENREAKIDSDLDSFFNFGKTALEEASKKQQEQLRREVADENDSFAFRQRFRDMRLEADMREQERRMQFPSGESRRFAGGQDRFGTGLVERFDQDKPVKELQQLNKQMNESGKVLAQIAASLVPGVPVVIGLGLN